MIEVVSVRAEALVEVIRKKFEEGPPDAREEMYREEWKPVEDYGSGSAIMLD